MFDELMKGVEAGGASGAIRIRATYQPTGGSGAKVAPPTYPNEQRYIKERRYLDGSLTETVLIDAVQSQANRVEEALVGAIDDGLLQLPYLVTSAEIDDVAFRITSLDAPHRSPDAYFRDSETLDGTPFDSSDIGKALRAANERNARAIYMHSPVDLVLGVWDSQRGGRGLRLPRAYSSEMIGVDPSEGARAAGRLDPYNIPSTEVFQSDEDKTQWSLDASHIKGKSKKGKTSNINHGNALASDSPGGFAVSEVQRVAVLSLKVLRRLRFPDGAAASRKVDAAARAVLAALTILGDRLAFSDSTLFLRSGCDLALQTESAEWVGRGAPTPVELPDVGGAFALLAEAVAQAESLGLAFAEPVQLRPKANLRDLLALTFASPAQED